MISKDVEPTSQAESAALQALERFVVENDDLIQLEAQIRGFNIFDALRIARTEIRHSNFLAFILDPVESHGQGQLFLKALLMDLLKNAPSAARPLSPIDLDGGDLRGVEVRREWRNIDLLIICKEPRFGVVVENKIDSDEHSNQLVLYEQRIKDHYPDLPVLYVFLSPSGSKASHASWLPYSYKQVFHVLNRVRDVHQNSIGSEVLVFLNHYLDLLGTRFMDNEKLDELCRRIYKNHRRALQLIWERVGSPATSVIAEVLSILEVDTRWKLLYTSNKSVDFVPHAWEKWLPPYDPEDSYAPFTIHIRSWEAKLVFSLWVGPMQDQMMRSAIITKLRDVGPALAFKATKASKVEGNWNRVTSAELILQWSEDEEPDQQAIHDALKKKLDSLESRLKKLETILKPLCTM